MVGSQGAASAVKSSLSRFPAPYALNFADFPARRSPVGRSNCACLLVKQATPMWTLIGTRFHQSDDCQNALDGVRMLCW